MRQIEFVTTTRVAAGSFTVVAGGGAVTKLLGARSSNPSGRLSPQRHWHRTPPVAYVTRSTTEHFVLETRLDLPLPM